MFSVRFILSVLLCIVLFLQSPVSFATSDISTKQQTQIATLTDFCENLIQTNAKNDSTKETLYRNRVIQSLRMKKQALKNKKTITVLDGIINNLEIKNDIGHMDVPKGATLSSTIGTQMSTGVADKTFYFVASVYLDGRGTNATTIDEIEKMRSQLASIDKNLKVSWAMSNTFVFEESHRPQLAKVLEMVDAYGDEISLGYGFPNNQHTLESFQGQVKEWVYMYRYNALNSLHVPGTMNDTQSVFASIPEKYRPTSVTTYAINPEQATWVRETYGIDTFMGWTATQYRVDQLSGEGSPLMPYWSHKNNPLVPAQDSDSNSQNVFMNTITVDPIGSSYTGGESRWTIHPADPLTDGKSQIHTIRQYMNNPYKGTNNINYLSLFIDINWMLRDKQLESNWEDMIATWPKDTAVNIVGLKGFAEKFKKTVGSNNEQARFTLLFRGSGEMRSGYVSPSDIRYLWMETRTERIVLKKRDFEYLWRIIDFTDYTKNPIPILRYTTKGSEEDVSYVTGRSFKLNPTAKLTDAERVRIKTRLADIGFREDVVYEY